MFAGLEKPGIGRPRSRKDVELSVSAQHVCRGLRDVQVQLRAEWRPECLGAGVVGAEQDGLALESGHRDIVLVREAAEARQLDDLAAISSHGRLDPFSSAGRGLLASEEPAARPEALVLAKEGRGAEPLKQEARSLSGDGVRAAPDPERRGVDDQPRHPRIRKHSVNATARDLMVGEHDQGAVVLSDCSESVGDRRPDAQFGIGVGLLTGEWVAHREDRLEPGARDEDARLRRLIGDESIPLFGGEAGRGCCGIGGFRLLLVAGKKGDSCRRVVRIVQRQVTLIGASRLPARRAPARPARSPMPR